MKECVCVWGGKSVITGTHKTIRIAFAVSYGKGERMIISHAICFSMIQKHMQRKQPEDLWCSGKALRAFHAISQGCGRTKTCFTSYC